MSLPLLVHGFGMAKAWVFGELEDELAFAWFCVCGFGMDKDCFWVWLRLVYVCFPVEGELASSLVCCVFLRSFFLYL